MAGRQSQSLQEAVAPGVRIARIEPIQARIAGNRRRIAAFMALFTGGVGAALALSVGLAGAPLAMFYVTTVAVQASTSPVVLVARAVGITFIAGALGAWVWALIQLARSERVLVRRFGARVSAGGTLLPTKSVLRDMAIAGGLPCPPQLYVIDTPRVNAFVLGRTPARVRVGVTQGFLDRVPLDEQRAVFANLVARVLSGDTMWASAVSAIMGPVWAMRDRGLRREGDADTRAFSSGENSGPDDTAGSRLILEGALIVVTEFSSWYHREAAWSAAEKADAEGMMLLKDPRSMLRAIEHVLDCDNYVVTAGDAYSQVFFCWAGYGFASEDDPEMRRVARLRETLGAEGAAYIPRPNVPDWPGAPVAPRMELAEKLAGEAGPGPGVA